MIIRATNRSDIPAVDALLATSYPVLLKPDYPASVMVTALPLISRAQPSLVTSGTYFGLWDDKGDLVGAGGWTRANARGEKVAKTVGNIRHVVTSHLHTRRGFGRALMTHIFENAKAVGIEAMHCDATRTAVPFYQSMGFVALGQIEIPLRAGINFPAVRMRRAQL